MVQMTLRVLSNQPWSTTPANASSSSLWSHLKPLQRGGGGMSCILKLLKRGFQFRNIWPTLSKGTRQSEFLNFQLSRLRPLQRTCFFSTLLMQVSNLKECHRCHMTHGNNINFEVVHLEDCCSSSGFVLAQYLLLKNKMSISQNTHLSKLNNIQQGVHTFPPRASG